MASNEGEVEGHFLQRGRRQKKGMGEKALTSVFCIDGSVSHYGRSPGITVIFQYMYKKTTPERFLRDHLLEHSYPAVNANENVYFSQTSIIF